MLQNLLREKSREWGPAGRMPESLSLPQPQPWWFSFCLCCILCFCDFLSFGYRLLENHHLLSAMLSAVHGRSLGLMLLCLSCKTPASRNLHSFWKTQFYAIVKRREQCKERLNSVLSDVLEASDSQLRKKEMSG